MKLADDQYPLAGFVQVDDVYWGGRRSGGKRGRGAEGKTPFIAAIQRNTKGNPLFIRFSRVGNFGSSSIERWGKKHLSPATVIVFDGLSCFQSFYNIGHFQFPVKTTGRYGEPDFHIFDWLNTVIGNVKNSIKATYHGLNHKHLPRYLGELCYRFNRCADLQNLLKALLFHSAQIGPIPKHQLRLAEDWW